MQGVDQWRPAEFAPQRTHILLDQARTSSFTLPLARRQIIVSEEECEGREEPRAGTRETLNRFCFAQNDKRNVMANLV
jgi:hypothetical protein